MSGLEADEGAGALAPRDLALIQIDALTWIGSAPRGEHGALRHPASRLVPSPLMRTPYFCLHVLRRRREGTHSGPLTDPACPLAAAQTSGCGIL